MNTPPSAPRAAATLLAPARRFGRASTLALSVALALGSAACAPADDGASVAQQEGAQTAATDGTNVVLWRGFEHEWLRDVAGFRVPHRISKLDSLVQAEQHFGQGASWRADADVALGQSTGVDGNYMKPRIAVGALGAPGLRVKRGEVHLAWRDQADGAAYPKAVSEIHDTIRIDLDDPAIAYGALDGYVAILQGIALETHCPEDESCNSNGMWPHRFGIELGTCALEADALVCPVDVAVHRSWTPNLGGVPPFEVKPFSDRLEIDIRVAYAIVGGDAGTFHATAPQAVEGEGRAHDRDPVVRAASLQGVADNAYTYATSAVTGFGFELFRADDMKADKTQHLGRYIGALRFVAEDDGYDPLSGELRATTLAQVWAPDSVVDSGVRTHMTVVGLQLDGAGARVAPTQHVDSSLCINSSDQAPALTRWRKCDSPSKGPARSQVVERVSF